MAGTTHKVTTFQDAALERQTLELVKGVRAAQKTTTDHASATSGVHGVGESEVESKAGAQAKADAVQANLNAHAARTDNPHGVTAAQVGAVSKAGDTMTGKLAIVLSNDAWVDCKAGSSMRVGVGANTNGFLAAKLDPSTGAWLTTWVSANDTLFTYQGNTVWHAGNDGAGSGLDADMLDGYHASYFQPASDERLKADIEPLADALARALSLRGVSFVWNDKAQEIGANRQTLAGREIGLLAGDVAQVVPEVVLDWVETPDGVKYKTVDSARLVALLVEAIKELNAKVESLQAQVAALKPA